MDAEKPKDALTITSLKGKMEIVTDDDEKEAETVLRLTTNTCPVGVMFKNCGNQIRLGTYSKEELG